MFQGFHSEQCVKSAAITPPLNGVAVGGDKPNKQILPCTDASFKL